MMKYTIERKEYSNTDIVTVIGKNAKQEIMTMEITHCKNSGGANALPNLWHKHGFIDRVLETYLNVSTYVYDSEGDCWGLYNVQTKRSEDNKRTVINFDWMLEDTEENMIKLIEACIRLFKSAAGKSATEIKMDKIREYAKEHNMKVVYEKPENWIEFPSIDTPMGCVRIVNERRMKKVDGKFIRNKNYQEAMLVI